MKYKQVSNTAGVEELSEVTFDFFRESWITRYPNDPSKMVSFESDKSIIFPLAKHKLVLYAVMHVYNIFQSVLHGSDKTEVNEITKAELERADENGELCMYISVLLHTLLTKFDMIDADDLDYVQGYYRHKSVWGAIGLPDYDIGIHAWLAYKGKSVLDATIGQQHMSFDFKKKTPLIIGDIPKGIELVGYIEPKGVVEEYANRYATESGMLYDEWCKFHYGAMMAETAEELLKIERKRQGL